MCIQNSLLISDVSRNCVLIWDFVTNSTAPLFFPIVIETTLTETMFKHFVIQIVGTFFQVCASPPILRKGPRMRWEERIKNQIWYTSQSLELTNYCWEAPTYIGKFRTNWLTGKNLPDLTMTWSMCPLSRDGSEPRKSVRLSNMVVEIPRPTNTNTNTNINTNTNTNTNTPVPFYKSDIGIVQGWIWTTKVSSAEH